MKIGFDNGGLHKRISYEDVDGTTVIRFLEQAVEYFMNISIAELKQFDGTFVFNLIHSLRPIYSNFEAYQESVNEDSSDVTGYIVIDVDNIKNDIFENTVDLYSVDKSAHNGVKYTGTFFSRNNLNIRNILNHKIVYINSYDRYNYKWLNNKNVSFNATPFQLINFILGFIYIDIESNSLVDNLDVDILMDACFEIKPK